MKNRFKAFLPAVFLVRVFAPAPVASNPGRMPLSSGWECRPSRLERCRALVE